MTSEFYMHPIYKCLYVQCGIINLRFQTNTQFASSREDTIFSLLYGYYPRKHICFMYNKEVRSWINWKPFLVFFLLANLSSNAFLCESANKKFKQLPKRSLFMVFYKKDRFVCGKTQKKKLLK